MACTLGPTGSSSRLMLRDSAKVDNDLEHAAVQVRPRPVCLVQPSRVSICLSISSIAAGSPAKYQGQIPSMAPEP